MTTAEVAAIRTSRQQRPTSKKGLSLLSLVILALALVGAIVAAASSAPVIWILAWPAPLIVIFTAARFIREGYHKRDGLLVLGRPLASQTSAVSDSPTDDLAEDDTRGNVDPGIAVVDPLSVLGPSGRVELAKALDLATSREAAERRRQSEKLFHEGKRSLAHT
ncbi:MAG: hypothetical protein JOZ08_18965 [Verrucomicrobia bacterium]|nr:hypothetical protein [Verrucomicrobiota bacterium]